MKRAGRIRVLDTRAAVGDIILRGRHGGAYCQHYRVIARVGDDVILEAVEPVSVKGDDGIFSTVWKEDQR